MCAVLFELVLPCKTNELIQPHTEQACQVPLPAVFGRDPCADSVRQYHSIEWIVQFCRNLATLLSKIQYLKGNIFFLPSCKEGNASREKDVSQTCF